LKKCDAEKRFKGLNPEPSCSLSLHSQPVVFDLLEMELVIYIYEQFNFYNTKILFFLLFLQEERMNLEEGMKRELHEILSWWNMDYVGAS
jgi:hypothetical protein